MSRIKSDAAQTVPRKQRPHHERNHALINPFTLAILKLQAVNFTCGTVAEVA